MKVYHYSKLSNWNRLKNGEMYDDESGLSTRSCLSPHTEKGWKTRCSFSLLSPEPKEWVSNITYPNIWNDLMNKTGKLLLEVNIRHYLESSYVVDFVHQESYAKKIRNGGTKSNEEYLQSHIDYVNSIVPLKKYLKRRKELSYQLPEVIITRRIPMENIRVSNYQPRIETSLKKWPKGSSLYESIRRDVAWVDEMKTWAERYGDEDLLRAYEKVAELRGEFNGPNRTSKER